MCQTQYTLHYYNENYCDLEFQVGDYIEFKTDGKIYGGYVSKFINKNIFKISDLAIEEIEFNPDDDDFFDENDAIDFKKRSSYLMEDVKIYSSKN